MLNITLFNDPFIAENQVKLTINEDKNHVQVLVHYRFPNTPEGVVNSLSKEFGTLVVKQASDLDIDTDKIGATLQTLISGTPEASGSPYQFQIYGAKHCNLHQASSECARHSCREGKIAQHYALQQPTTGRRSDQDHHQ